MNSRWQSNGLASSQSLYLQQHANHPVHWQPYSAEVFAHAQNQNKLVIVSIGYSTCHWCHVMAHRVFQRPDVANLMNANFISVKVDREERPDIDMVYMRAVQLMGTPGGWPLNVITTPEGVPIFGGTYIPADDWMRVLDQVHALYQNEPERILEFSRGMKEALSLSTSETRENSVENDPAWQRWLDEYDALNGGLRGAPKFPMPVLLGYLLDACTVSQSALLRNALETTLTKMAASGLHDQVESGFFRYATDAGWRIPHFEKMLYDNAQLACVYHLAGTQWKLPWMQQLAADVADWVNHALHRSDGWVGSATNADHQGKEGAYYEVSPEELATLQPEVKKLCEQHMGIADGRAWWDEEQAYVLQGSVELLQNRKEQVALKRALLPLRNERGTPETDLKPNTTWNLLWAHTQLTLGHGEVSELFQRFSTLRALHKGLLPAVANHSPEEAVYFLCSQAFWLNWLVHAYLLQPDNSFLSEAESVLETIDQRFARTRNQLVSYNPLSNDLAFGNPVETADDVIASSNSVLCEAILALGHLTSNQAYLARSEKMVNAVQADMQNYPLSHSNWHRVAALHAQGKLIVCTGEHAEQDAHELRNRLGRSHFVTGSSTYTSGIYSGRQSHANRIFICEKNQCLEPVNAVNDALALLLPPQ